MDCAPCTIRQTDPIPEAVTQIGGTAVCAACAAEIADGPGAARDIALRPTVMRRRREAAGLRGAQPKAE